MSHLSGSDQPEASAPRTGHDLGGSTSPSTSADHAKHLADGVAAGARFRGEEAANVVRAVVALLLLGMHDEPWAALAAGCVVLAVATLVRTGETRTALSIITIGFDTTLLVWGITLALPDAAIVAMGVVGSCSR